jgi:group I intron endonuclease
MTSKLTKSKIQVSGRAFITAPINGKLTGLSVDLNGLKQSKSGVYEILNKLNGKRYIGMSTNLENRMKHHWWDLDHNKHKSSEMQKEYNDLATSIICHPEDLFEFNVVIYCYLSELTFWEKILIDNIHPEYNTKKKKVLPPKVFDIDGNKINNDPIPDIDENWEEIKSIGESNVNSCDDDIEEEIM